MTTLETLPLDHLGDILKLLKPTDLLNSVLATSSLAENFAKMLPAIRELKIRILDGELKGSYDGTAIDLQISQKNLTETEEILRTVLPRLVETVDSLHLENDMINEEISDASFANLLDLVRNAPLKELALSEIDLNNIQTWTLALLAGLTNLEKLEIEECKFGENTEARLLRCLQSSFQTLTQIDLKGTPEITDNFSHRVSRHCPNLSYFRISDCPRVTTLSALPFIESTIFRLTDKLDVHMDNTGFDADRLRAFMRSPLFGSCSEEWSLEPVVVPLGCNKPAVLALHSSRKIVLIFV